MIEILDLINKLKNSTFDKQKSLECLERYCELNMWFCGNDGGCDNCKDRCNIWQKGYNAAKDKFEESEPIKANCGNCTHGAQITYCKRWENAFIAGEEACFE